ncbi:hypothetical protein PHLCEN_2v306 [Hermanssonia centrifuga]|uniref:Aldehyde dehydrogenase domain-containing protein n=1 Tax=Hermanssonia centrifuga TaxID=98765 RepID=A0A2R6S6C2_9APHY|nr:hypothetical protein PHLCEN_2v306 [Hermanssonia centrifuga]
MSAAFTKQVISPLFNGEVTLDTRLLINGERVDSVDKATIDGEVITAVSLGSAEDINAAVAAAKHAYKTVWGQKVSAYERGRLLSKLADLMEEHIDEICALEALDSGKHFLIVKSMDFPRAIQTVRYYAGWADKHHGQTIETNEAKFAYTRHEPIGVVGLITPWNFPLLIETWKIAPALATGNAVVLKPSEIAPLCALKFAELVTKAGFPPGVFNVVPGYGSTAGQALAEHMDVGSIGFTGSTAVGRKIMETSAKTNLKRVSLELGGKNPTIIFDDADLTLALGWVVPGVFIHSGQVCVAGTRIFVQETIYDKFLEIFTAATSQGIKKGSSPFDPTGLHSPLISKAQYERVMNYISSGKQEGASLHIGGQRIGTTGYFVEPTIFTDVTPEMKIVREEIFGPVAVIMKFKDEADAIEKANNTVYGLSSVVFTQDINKAVRVAHAMEAGSAFVGAF